MSVQTKNTPETDAESASGVFYLPALVPVVCLACILGKEPLHVLLRPQKLLHFFTGFAVFGVSCFLLLHERSILGVQILDPGQLLQVLLIEKVLGSLVQQNLRFMLRTELSAVSGLAVSCVHLLA